MGAWRTTGFRYMPSGQKVWAQNYAAVPTALHRHGSEFRIYFSTRDSLSRSRVGWVDISLSDTSDRIRVVAEAAHPVLDLGDPGHFDCDGIYGTSLVPTSDGLRFYYGGWNAGLRGYFYSSVGMAISRDGGESFERYSAAPILGRDEVDPWACLAPCVLQTSESLWMMWYVSGKRMWHDADGELRSQYDVKTATSVDGVTWKKSNRSAISLRDDETNIGRPSVIVSDNGFEAWYSYVDVKSQQYQIGYGRSLDGMTFDRADNAAEAAIAPTGNPADWDGLAVAYPNLLLHQGRRYLLYNGNSNGASGFGIAVWEEGRDGQSGESVRSGLRRLFR